MSRSFAVTVCDCGERISTTADEVLTFETTECPNCGTDVCYADGLYEKALALADPDEPNLMIDDDSGCSSYINMDLQQILNGD